MNLLIYGDISGPSALGKFISTCPSRNDDRFEEIHSHDQNMILLKK